MDPSNLAPYPVFKISDLDPALNELKNVRFFVVVFIPSSLRKYNFFSMKLVDVLLFNDPDPPGHKVPLCKWFGILAISSFHN